MEDDNNGFWDELSHEIRNSLHIILGSSNLLSSGEYYDQSELISNIQVSARQLQGMLNSYLSERKGNVQHHGSNGESLQLPMLLHELVLQHKAFAEEKRLKLKLEIDSKIPESLMGAQAKLVQVLNNLISNAIHYTEKGEVVITAKLLALKSGAVDIRLLVSDTGPGISDEDQKKLFNEFVQINNGKKGDGKRFGLGLVICKRILHAMNSEIKLKSTLGEGSCFYFDVSFSPDLVEKPKMGKNYLLLPESKVLVVDDSPINRFIMEKLLNRIGVRYDSVGTGEEALKLVSENRYAMLLLDVNLNGMNGISLSRELKRKFIETRIILVSADVEILESDLIKEIGVHTTLVKPFTPDELQQAISNELLRVEHHQSMS